MLLLLLCLIQFTSAAFNLHLITSEAAAAVSAVASQLSALWILNCKRGAGGEEETPEIAISASQDVMAKKTVERCQLAMNFGNVIWLNIIQCDHWQQQQQLNCLSGAAIASSSALKVCILTSSYSKKFTIIFVPHFN